MDNRRIIAEHIGQIYEESQDLVQKWFDCLPEEWGDIGFPSTLLGALHFTAIIAQADERMSKETFATLSEEAWDFIADKSENVKKLEEVLAKEQLH